MNDTKKKKLSDFKLSRHMVGGFFKIDHIRSLIYGTVFTTKYPKIKIIGKTKIDVMDGDKIVASFLYHEKDSVYGEWWMTVYNSTYPNDKPNLVRSK